jgi:hypothetical protein
MMKADHLRHSPREEGSRVRKDIKMVFISLLLSWKTINQPPPKQATRILKTAHFLNQSYPYSKDKMKFSTLFFLNALIALAGAATIPQPEGLVERDCGPSMYSLRVTSFAKRMERK